MNTTTSTNTIRLNLHEDRVFRFFYTEGNKWGDFDSWCERNGFKVSYQEPTATSTTTTTTTSSTSSRYTTPYKSRSNYQAPNAPRKHYSHRPPLPPAKKSKVTTNLFSLLEDDE